MVFRRLCALLAVTAVVLASGCHKGHYLRHGGGCYSPCIPAPCCETTYCNYSPIGVESTAPPAFYGPVYGR
jgi:hypothetical protein